MLVLIRSNQRVIGAVNAIQDAIALANWINTLNAYATWDETAKVFSEYQSERHPWAQHAFTDSQVMSKLVAMVKKEIRLYPNSPQNGHRMHA